MGASTSAPTRKPTTPSPTTANPTFDGVSEEQFKSNEDVFKKAVQEPLKSQGVRVEHITFVIVSRRRILAAASKLLVETEIDTSDAKAVTNGLEDPGFLEAVTTNVQESGVEELEDVDASEVGAITVDNANTIDDSSDSKKSLAWLYAVIITSAIVLILWAGAAYVKLNERDAKIAETKNALQLTELSSTQGGSNFMEAVWNKA